MDHLLTRFLCLKSTCIASFRDDTSNTLIQQTIMRFNGIPVTHFLLSQIKWEEKATRAGGLRVRKNIYIAIVIKVPGMLVRAAKAVYLAGKRMFSNIRFPILPHKQIVHWGHMQGTTDFWAYRLENTRNHLQFGSKTACLYQKQNKITSFGRL